MTAYLLWAAWLVVQIDSVMYSKHDVGRAQPQWVNKEVDASERVRPMFRHD